MASLNQVFQHPANIPPPKLNGGLYSGEPFAKGAPWGNVPVVPDAGYMIHYNLRSANPPTEALYQYPGYDRPGNNKANMIGVVPSRPEYNMSFIQAIPKAPDCACNKCQFTKYAYL